MTTALYVPGTSEKDPAKLIMSQQLVAGQTATNTDSIATANTNITTNTTNIATNTTNITTLQTPNYGLVNTAGALGVSLSKITASLGADVALNNTANYFDGPSVAQGTTGTWFASGTVTLNTSGNDNFRVRLWDGTTVIASTETTNTGTGVAFLITVALSGFITSPAANIRISVKDVTSVNGKILFNHSGDSKDSTVTAIRIA